MTFKYTELVDSPNSLKKNLPATNQQLDFIDRTRHEIVKILDESDPRLLLIVGPCSIHDISAAKEYAHKLQILKDFVSSSFLIIMRTHFEKPRTGLGWKGMIYDPHLNDSHDIATGIKQARQLLLDLCTLRIPTATEFLDPVAPLFLGDLISWGCIGARTAESQIHRQLASGLDMPIAFKNNTSGNIEVAIRGAIVARAPHTFFGVNDDGCLSIVQTEGNAHTHIVLRGGEAHPNYSDTSIVSASEQMLKLGINPCLIVDCAHDNSSRIYTEQETVFKSAIEQYQRGNTAIRGMILESHLFAGNQPLTKNHSLLRYAVSLTDPCLDWISTERLILEAHSKQLSKCV